ncbi:MAG: hypothetical protein BGO76_01025 [Caedibacter sp. 38-128]|nr:LysR family transcriptional regulator [Holosporales bacterium]OJX05723.1 MAG: hypothetical protein BGO76_01025 [Caedibacter sp. 38-128]
MDLDKLRIFYYAAKAKSFTNCDLNLSPSAVSRHISDLEHRLKAPLFYRQGRGLSLTDQGEVLFESAHKIFAELDAARSLLNEVGVEPQGVLRIAIPGGWTATILIQYIAEFLKQYPKIRLHMIPIERLNEFTLNEVDAAIVPFMPDRPTWIQRHLMQFHLKLFASPEYLATHGTPKIIEDLDSHHMITHGTYGHTLSDLKWHLALGIKDSKARDPYLIVCSPYHAAEQGLGIVTLAQENLLLRSGKLVEVLPEVKGPTIDAYYVYPEHLKDSKKVRLLGDYIVNFIKKTKNLSNLPKVA